MQDSNQDTMMQSQMKKKDTPDPYAKIRSYAFAYKEAFPDSQPIAVIFDRAALLRILNITDTTPAASPAYIAGVLGYHHEENPKMVTVSLLRVNKSSDGYIADPNHVDASVDGEQIWPAVMMENIDMLLPAPIETGNK